MQEVGPSLKVTPIFSHHTYSVHPSVSKGYYNGLFERNGKISLLSKQWLLEYLTLAKITT